MFSQILWVLFPLPKLENYNHSQTCPCRHCKSFYLCELYCFDVVDIVGHKEPPSRDVYFDSSPGIIKKFAREFKKRILPHMPDKLVQDIYV
jgi:hypothetical protein